MALTRTVSLKMFADTAAAQAKLDAIAAEADKLGKKNPEIKPQIEKAAALRQMAVLRAELKAEGDKAGQDLGGAISDGTKKKLGAKAGGGGSWIAAAVGLGAPLTGELAAGGLAFAAFGALAAGSLAPVAKAMSGPGGLAAGWATLDARQKTAAAGVEALKTRYDGLSKSMEPRAFQVFNTLLSTANSLLGPSARLATTSGAAVEGFLVKFENDSGLRRFIGYASTVAPQAISLLGDDVTSLVHSVLTLAQAAGGAGLLELRLLTSGLQILDKVISHLPAPLEGAALGIGGVALAMSKLGLLSRALKLTGVADIASSLSGFSTAAKDATIAEKGLLAGSTALKAITPWGWVALGVGALIALNSVMSKTTDETDRFIATAEKTDHATGFNTAGYKLAAQSLDAYTQNLVVHEQEQRKQVEGTRAAALGLNQYSGAADRSAQETERLSLAAKSQNTFLGTLQQKYGLTRAAAITLAEHAGVLASQVNKGGSAMRNALTQAGAFADSMRKADPPAGVLGTDLFVMGKNAEQAASKINQVNTAWDTFLGMSSDLETAELGVIGQMRQVAKDSKAAGASFTGVNNASVTLRTDFTGLITSTQGVIDKMRAAGAPTSKLATQVGTNLKQAVDAGALSNKALRAQILAMANEAGYTGPNKIAPLTRFIDSHAKAVAKAARNVDDLAAAEARLPKHENLSISVLGTGSWSVRGGNTGGAGHPQPPGGPGFAAGGRITAGTTPTADDVLIRASKDETVLSAAHSRQLAPLLAAVGVPGYKSGGVVGHYAGPVPGMGKWLRSEDQATTHAIAAATAKATAAALRSVMGGGTGREVARYALGYNAGTAIPYVLGGATPQGWDCSGFTAWVYEHFGLMPGRQGQRFGTSETQAAWVKRTPGPEVGGLAFFNDGVFANPGHVGIITSPTTYILAHSPQTGTTNSPISGAVMFGIPPGRTIGGFESGSPQGGGKPLPGGGSAAANRAVGLQEATSFGWGTGPSWHDLDLLWNKASGWRNTAQNPTSTAYGIPQFLDGTWATVGGRKTSNPGLQILYGLRYIQRKYGDPENAWAHERAFNWYGSGTRGAKPGWAVVGERGAELVRMRGGEDVIPAGPSAELLGLPGFVSGTGPVGGSGGPAGSGGGASAAERRAGMALLAWFSHLRPGTSTASIRSEETRYLRDIAKYFSGSSAKWRDAEVKRQTGHLIRVGDKIGALNSRIAAARSYQQSVRQGLSGFADLSQMTLGGSMQGSRTVSGAQSLNQQLHGQLGTLKTFAQVLRKLSAAKVSPALIRQVVDLGPGDGTAFGQEILAGGPALIKSLNATEKAIGATETAISRGAASAVYEGKYRPGKNFLSDLQHERAGLEKLFRHIGAELGREAARWFRARGVREHPGPPGRPAPRPPGRGRREHPGLGPYLPAGYAATPAGAATAAALVHIENVHVREAADIAIIGQKVGFAVAAAGLG